MSVQQFDTAIIGGGLAGLALSIQLARLGHDVVLIEKEAYPYHKVCGEYISNESLPFLLRIGIPLQQMDLPQIRRLQLTAPNGRLLQAALPLGGFGISRYTLDATLAQTARAAGVTLMEGTKVEEVTGNGPFVVRFHASAGGGSLQARTCCGAYGKRANLDVKWERSFLKGQDRRLDNYVGIKYHVRLDWPEDLIGLHNFEQGYCGISKVDGERYCLCYLTHAHILKTSGGIEGLQQKVLFRNPHLRRIFEQAEILPGFPVTISQVNFSPRTQVDQGVLMLGDAAGMIAPLCGNGMSMALHSSLLAATALDDYLSGKAGHREMEARYRSAWQHHFGSRLRTGRFIQRFFGSERLSNAFIRTFQLLPFLVRPVIRQTHGKPF